MAEFLKKGYEIEIFMKNVCCKDNVCRLHSVSITRGYCSLRNMTYNYEKCFCFRCILKKLRRKIKNPCFININNYTEITDEQIFACLIIFEL